MKKPNFFIIGAPKCGTTSWSIWLSEHPEIYFSPYKEPHFFNTDESYYHFVSSLDEYESLFSHANESHKAVGEGSVWYLHSKTAVDNILSYNPFAKFIVCIRNPVEMAYALHAEMVWTGEEHIKNFYQAWLLQSKRRQGLAVTRWAKEPSHLVCGDACFLGQQIARLKTKISSHQMHIIVLDDVKKNPRTEYLKVLDFLGVNDFGFNDFVPRNTSKTVRHPILMRLMRLVGQAKKKMGIKAGFGMANSLMSLSRSGPPREPLKKEMENYLKEFFKEDVCLLSTMIDRDLTHWVSS